MGFWGDLVLYKENMDKLFFFFLTKPTKLYVDKDKLFQYLGLYFSLSFLPRKKLHERSDSHHLGEESFIAFGAPNCVSSE